MEDIKSLCKRCVVVNGGSKIYDGDLNTLFEYYQTHKVIRVSFDEPVSYIPSFQVDILEQNPYSLSFMVEKKYVKPILADIMSKGEISDISIEEEDIGNVVERIYENKLSSKEKAQYVIKGVVNE